jgi:hypothetical protein
LLKLEHESFSQPVTWRLAKKRQIENPKVIEKGDTTMKKILSPNVHGVLDYVTGVSLLALPQVLNLPEDSEESASSVLRMAGTTILLQAVVTDYKMGLVRKVPFKLHLSNDYLLSSALAASPLILRFRDGRSRKTWLPHVLIGLYIFLSTLMTRTEPIKKQAPIIHLVKKVAERIS